MNLDQLWILLTLHRVLWMTAQIIRGWIEEVTLTRWLVEHWQFVLRILLLGRCWWYLMHTLAFEIVASNLWLIVILEISTSHMCKCLRLHTAGNVTTLDSTIWWPVTSYLLILRNSINAFECLVRTLWWRLIAHHSIRHVSSAVVDQRMSSNIILYLPGLR